MTFTLELSDGCGYVVKRDTFPSWKELCAYLKKDFVEEFPVLKKFTCPDNAVYSYKVVPNPQTEAEKLAVNSFNIQQKKLKQLKKEVQALKKELSTFFEE